MKNITQPRYLVIADYPKSIYKIGEILECGLTYQDLLFADREGPRMSQYPHLFRLLHWWEYRDEKEMPEYVKHRDKIYKVTGWRDNSPYYEGGKHPFAPEVVTPATLNEYNEYIKNK